MSTNNVNIKVGLDGSEFNKGVTATITEFNALKLTVGQNKIAWQESNQELKKFAQEYKATGTKTQEMKDKLATLKTTVESNKIAYGDAKLSLDKYKQEMGNITPAANNLKNSITKVNGALASFGVGVSFIAVANEMKMAGQAYEEQLKTTNLFNSTLKATGYASGETAAELEVLAQKYSSLTGIQDENIAAAEDMLLTFRNIGKDVFPDATQATLDMATAMNHGMAPSAEDLTKTAIRLGKALNDPISGMTALRKVGVAFTQDQQDMIKQLVKSGQGLEAQKLILKELEGEFGGTAEAAQTMGNKATVAFDQMQQSIGHFEEGGAGKGIMKWWIAQENELTNLINKIRIYTTSINELSLKDAETKLAHVNSLGLGLPGGGEKEKKALEDRIKLLKEQQKQEMEKAKSSSSNGQGENNFNKGITKQGKSQDTLISEHVSLLKAQSDLEINSNDYTDAEILKKRIELYKKIEAIENSSTTKGKAEKIQSQAELLGLEKQYNEQVVNDKIKALEQTSAENKIYAQMDTIDELNNMSLTEKQRQDIKNKSTLEQLKAEVNLQQQILELKSRGVTDLSQLNEKDRQEYEAQLLNKLNAEKDYQAELSTIKDQEREKNKHYADSISNTLADGLKSAIDGTKTLAESFSDMLETMAADLMTSALKKELEGLFNNLSQQSNTTSTGVSSGGGFWSMLLGSVSNFFADGGNPPVGVPSIVGEKGPELFVPNTAGTIIPNNMINQYTSTSSSITTQNQQQAPNYIYAPQVTTKAKKEDVMSALYESSREFFTFVGGGIQDNKGNIRPILQGIK